MFRRTSDVVSYPLVMTNIVMEHGSFIDGLPFLKPPFVLGIFHGYVK